MGKIKELDHTKIYDPIIKLKRVGFNPIHWIMECVICRKDFISLNPTFKFCNNSECLEEKLRYSRKRDAYVQRKAKRFRWSKSNT